MRAPKWVTTPRRLYLLTGAAQGFMLSYGLAAVVWWVVDLELSPLRLVLLGTAAELTILLAEVPTGVIADRYSRKWSVVIAYLVMGAAEMAGPAVALFPVLIVWQIVWGIGWTFQSGADTAWITDEEGEPDDALIVRHALARSVGTLVGIPVVAALSVWSLRGAMVLTGAVTVAFGLYLAWTMTETRTRPLIETGRGRIAEALGLWRSGIDVVRRRPWVRSMILAVLLMSLADEAVDWLDVPRLIDLGLSDLDGGEAAVFFGVVWAVMTALNIPVMHITQRRLASARSDILETSLMVLILASSVGILALAGPWLAVALIGWTVRDVGREVIEPLTVAAVNRHEESDVRATVLSFRGQAQSLGLVVGGLVLGTLAELTSIPLALTVAAALVACAALPVASARRRRGREPLGPPPAPVAAVDQAPAVVDITPPWHRPLP